MSQREDPATSSQRGRPQRTVKKTDRMVQAGKDNLAKGRKKREQLRTEAEEAGQETRAERWAKLLDGTLTVRDLSDDEIARMAVKSKDGSFAGRKRALPSHLAQAFHQEAIRRANDKIRTAAPEAVQALLDIGRDPDVKESDRVRALMYIVDRAMGKTPETVRVEQGSRWDHLLDDAVGLDRGVAGEAERPSDAPTVQSD